MQDVPDQGRLEEQRCDYYLNHRLLAEADHADPQLRPEAALPTAAPTPPAPSIPPTTSRTSSGPTASSSAGRRRSAPNPPPPDRRIRDGAPHGRPVSFSPGSARRPSGAAVTVAPCAGSLPLLLAGLLCCQAPPAAPDATALSLPARWLQGYLRLDTTNPPGNEQRAAAYLETLLAEHGVPVAALVSPGGRTNLSARLRARPGVDGPALLLLHHMDVVAAGPGWHQPPFGGASSTTAGCTAAAPSTTRASASPSSPPSSTLAAPAGDALARDVVLLAVADEERGSAEGTAWLLRAHPELFRGVAGVLNEGGANRQVNGRLLWWGVEVAQKRPLWLEVAADGPRRPRRRASTRARRPTS